MQHRREPMAAPRVAAGFERIGHHQNARTQAVLAQPDALGDVADRQPTDALFFETMGHRARAVAIGIGLHHGHHLHGSHGLFDGPVIGRNPI